MDDVIEGTQGNFRWLNNSNSILFTVLDENHRPYAVKRHILNTKPNEDEQIYAESDPGFFVEISKSDSSKYLIIRSFDHQTSEARIIDASCETGVPHLIESRLTGCKYDIFHHGEKFLILTNIDQANDYKIVTAPLLAPSKDNWEDLIPHKSGVFILGIKIFEKFWVRIERFEGLERIIITQFESNESHKIIFGEMVYSLKLGEGHEFKTSNFTSTIRQCLLPR